MNSRFEEVLTHIEQLLIKIDQDLNVDGMNPDHSLFFKNIDKACEIFNVALEELCGQLNFMDLTQHSMVF